VAEPQSRRAAEGETEIKPRDIVEQRRVVSIVEECRRPRTAQHQTRRTVAAISRPCPPLGATTGLPLRRDQSRPPCKPDSIIILRPAPLFLLRARPSFLRSTSPHSRESRSLLINSCPLPSPGHVHPTDSYPQSLLLGFRCLLHLLALPSPTFTP
jgi:hypothetical protein